MVSPGRSGSETEDSRAARHLTSSRRPSMLLVTAALLRFRRTRRLRLGSRHRRPGRNRAHGIRRAPHLCRGPGGHGLRPGMGATRGLGRRHRGEPGEGTGRVCALRGPRLHRRGLHGERGLRPRSRELAPAFVRDPSRVLGLRRRRTPLRPPPPPGLPRLDEAGLHRRGRARPGGPELEPGGRRILRARTQAP